MQYYDFQPELIKAMPILSKTQLILTDNVDPNMVQDTIIHELLPGAFSIFGTQLRLNLVIVTIINNIAYWDLLFAYPVGYHAKNLLDHIYDQAIQLDDSFDHLQIGEDGIHKISFKVG